MGQYTSPEGVTGSQMSEALFIASQLTRGLSVHVFTAVGLRVVVGITKVPVPATDEEL